MDLIASSLSISKKTIYQYFRDKDELVEAIVLLQVEEERKVLSDIEKESIDAIDELYRIWKYISHKFKNMNPQIIFDLKKHHEGGYEIFKKHKEKFIADSVRKNLVRGIKDNFYRNDINVDVLSRLKIFEIEFAFDIDVFPMKEFKLLTVQSELFNHFFYGIATEEGRSLYKKIYRIRTNYK